MEMLDRRIGRDLRVEDQDVTGLPEQEIDKLPRSIEMIEQATTEDHVENAVVRDIPRIVLDEAQVWQVGAPRARFALLEIHLTRFESDSLAKAMTGKSFRVIPAEATEIENAGAQRLAPQALQRLQGRADCIKLDRPTGARL